MNPQKIVIVEDDPHILLGLEEILKSEGFEVVTCTQGLDAVEVISQQKPSLVILDIMLPGMSGYDICKSIRALKLFTPVLMLTAKSQEIDKVVGLEIGADDYVTKPFGIRELLARIHALLRRCQPSEKSKLSQQPFQIGGAIIDPKKYQIQRGAVIEELTAKELKILQIFYERPGEVFSRDHLLNTVWGYNYFGTTRTLDQVIVQLRKKMGDNGSNPVHLLTVHGVGYRLAL